MVIGDEFVWAHLGKAAGNSTLKMFKVIKHALKYFDEIDEHKKHQSFADKEKDMGIDLSAKNKILNMRRLPAWVLSHMNFQKMVYQVPFSDRTMEGIINTADPSQLQATGVNFRENNIDDQLRYYDYENISYWLRTEFLAQDFIEVLGKFTEIDSGQREQIGKVIENVNKNYNRNILESFTKEEMVKLYGSCPIWASIEKVVYGNLLIDEI